MSGHGDITKEVESTVAQASLPATDDGFLDGKLRILQPEKGYRAGLDAVLLAASIPARAGERVLEAGAGVGVGSLCLAARVPGVDVCGLEIQPELIALATENAERNQLQDNVIFLEGNIGLPVRDLVTRGLEPQSWHHVFANPPYHDPSSTSLPPDSGKAQSHMTLGSDLTDWVRFACVMVRPKGSITFIHRADALASLLSALEGHVGGIEVFPLWPAQGKPASRVLVRGMRGSRAKLSLRPGLVLHGRDGRFTPRTEAILRDGEPLHFDQPL